MGQRAFWQWGFCLLLGMGFGLAATELRAEPIKFLQGGQLQKTVDHTQLPAKTLSIEVYEPHEQVNVRYQAYPTREVFDQVFGPAWRAAEEVLFTCADGYQPSVPVKDILEHSSYLAVSREGSKGGEFTLVNKLQAQEKVTLGPLYLVWDNIRDKSLRAEGASQWPYQVVSIDLVRFQDRFAAMAPAKDAPPQVIEGFLTFRKACANCHRINGVGAEKAPELNYPVNVTEYYKEEYLKRWIDRPQSIRWQSPMPPFNPDHPQRKQAIDAIYSYLKHMAQHKKEPKS